MMRAISIIALSALVSLLSGCGCSTKREPVDEARVRMSDAAYTNLLVQTHSAQVQVASQMAAIRSEIERLGKGAEKRPEYVDLTNRLARCKAESEMLNNAVRMAIRDRLMKDSKAKGNLKK